jgi:lipopolysaccharide/colanic/teichoic acid biosynthesis glycosyltransferase
LPSSTDGHETGIRHHNSVWGLALLSPPLLFVSLLIKLDSPGPAIFRQERMGRGFRPFRIYKFRTLVQDAPGLGGL